MAYSNVGTPVFYIDNYMYNKAIGTTLTTPTNPLDQYGYITPESYPDFFTLNPSIAKSFSDEVTDASNSIIWGITMPPSVLDYDFLGNMKWYWSILNHATPMILVNFLDEFEDTNTESYAEVTANTEEVLNHSLNGAHMYYGSTILTYSGTTLPSQHTQLLFGGGSVGAISTGVQYTMPHSPDLELNMEIEFDGVKNITTSGGSDLANIRYTGNPLWVNGTNKTNPFDVYNWDSSLDVTQTGARRNGRKSWSLKFSYVSDTNLFSSNIRGSYYSEHGTDMTLSDHYDSGDIDTTNNVMMDTIETDDSFYAQVWNKTLGGALSFIFQPDSNFGDEFYICKFDQKSLKIEQSAYKVYDISLKIVEVW